MTHEHCAFSAPVMPDIQIKEEPKDIDEYDPAMPAVRYISQ